MYFGWKNYVLWTERGCGTADNSMLQGIRAVIKSIFSDTIEVKSFHAVLYCRRWRDCVAFYRDMLGFPATAASEIFTEVQVAPGSFIGLLNAARCRPPATQAGSLVLSFRVARVEEAQRALMQRGCSPSPIRRHPWGARLFELEDPEGRRLEFWCEESHGAVMHSKEGTT